jgi:preprotein translocase subunit SecA
MMHGVWQDFIRYVMHVDVQINRPVPQDAPVDAPTDAPADQANGATAGGNGGSGGRRALLQDATDDATLRNVQYSSPDDAESGGAASMAAAARAGATNSGNGGSGEGGAAPAPAATNTPTVRSEWDKTPRNAPCPCGSGKKYKLCHGR